MRFFNFDLYSQIWFENMQKRTVLLVEDNHDDIELAKRAFKKSKYSDKINLEIATDGVEALNYIFNDGRTPHLILLDLNLPKINGFQVLRKIKNDNKLKFIPLVILTSSRENGDMIKSYNLGANGYIQKPIDFIEFTEVIRKLGEYWIEINQHPKNLT